MKRTTSFHFWILIFLLLAASLANPLSALAQSTGYPVQQEAIINDFAGVITPEDRQTIIQQLEDYQRTTGVQVVVVTVKSFRSYGTGATSLPTFALNLFNQWGIGDAKRNDGVLILVATVDREVQITVGSGYGRRLDAPMQDVIDKKMIPYFKEEKYSRGITLAVEGVTREVSRDAKEIAAMSPLSIWYASLDNQLVWSVIGMALLVILIFDLFRRRKDGWAWLLIAILGGILVAFISAVLTPSNWSNGSGSYGRNRSFGGGGSGGGGFGGGGRSFGGGAHGKW